MNRQGKYKYTHYLIFFLFFPFLSFFLYTRNLSCAKKWRSVSQEVLDSVQHWQMVSYCHICLTVRFYMFILTFPAYKRRLEVVNRGFRFDTNNCSWGRTQSCWCTASGYNTLHALDVLPKIIPLPSPSSRIKLTVSSFLLLSKLIKSFLDLILTFVVVGRLFGRQWCCPSWPATACTLGPVF